MNALLLLLLRIAGIWNPLLVCCVLGWAGIDWCLFTGLEPISWESPLHFPFPACFGLICVLEFAIWLGTEHDWDLTGILVPFTIALLITLLLEGLAEACCWPFKIWPPHNSWQGLPCPVCQLSLFTAPGLVLDEFWGLFDENIDVISIKLKLNCYTVVGWWYQTFSDGGFYLMFSMCNLSLMLIQSKLYMLIPCNFDVNTI